MAQLHSSSALPSGDPAQPSTAEHREAHPVDITYGTNNEFGFDYLRDNMAWSTTSWSSVATSAVVDEVDLDALIDEARDAADHLRPGRAVRPLVRRVRPACRAARPCEEHDDEVDLASGPWSITEERRVERVDDWLGIDTCTSR